VAVNTQYPKLGNIYGTRHVHPAYEEESRATREGVLEAEWVASTEPAP